ncbi:MAG: DUF885 domain-containing protein [Thermomicrobiales bacterium]
MSEARQPFSAWLDDFFAAYYRRRPVNATFIGVHDHDDILPDFSAAGVAETMAEMTALLGDLRGVAAPETPTDRTLAEHFLTLQLWEFGSRHFQGGNPCVYTGEAIFGVLSLFLRPFTPLSERVDAAIARMEAIPAFLATAAQNIPSAPPTWTERAIRECTGAMHFLGNGVEMLIADEGITDPHFRSAAIGARHAFAAYQAFLTSEMRATTNDAYGCGGEAFERYMALGHALTITGAEIERYARDQFAEARARLDEGAAAFGVPDWRTALRLLRRIHPTAESYYARYQEQWDACHERAVAHDLVSWPEYPIRYIPRPRWVREAAPFLYFLPYRAPSPYDHLTVHDYLVEPIEPGMPIADQERRLEATNDSVIKMNHVIHHGAIGHHVQNWYASHAASRIGQVAAVDCASRIALFCGGTMAEGWSSYVVDLMGEVGFLTPLEAYAQHYARMRAAARAIVDVNLHHGRFSFDQAVAFYRDDTGMTQEAAYAETVKNTMFPGAAMIYLIGQGMIRDLRREMAAREGNGFSLRRFHDRFLSYGSIPVSLIAAEMRARRESP